MICKDKCNVVNPGCDCAPECSENRPEECLLYSKVSKVCIVFYGQKCGDRPCMLVQTN